MRRWGQITEAKPAQWYDEVAKKVYRPDLYRKAAEMLIDEGKLTKDEVPPADTDGYKPKTDAFIDGVAYDGAKPLEYLKKHEIGHQY
jgi:nitrate/nitrite transport system substrate-binding protein